MPLKRSAVPVGSSMPEVGVASQVQVQVPLSDMTGVLPLIALQGRVPVGGRLRWFLPKWEEIAKDDWVVSVVRDGYQIPFLQPPPLSEKPISLTAYQKGSERWVALGREVDSLLAKDAIELITPTTPGFYARLFVVTKRTGGWRPVLDV